MSDHTILGVLFIEAQLPFGFGLGYLVIGPLLTRWRFLS